jgi:capsular polysaccharide biosynthesis protein
MPAIARSEISDRQPAVRARGTARHHRVITREHGIGPDPEPPHPAPEPLPGDTTPPLNEPQPIDRPDAGA